MTYPAAGSAGPHGLPHRYLALHRALSRREPPVLEFTFAEIHRLGCSLPYRARADEAWWSNGPDGDPQRVSWLAAGRVVQQVDVQRSRVWFATVGESSTVAILDDARVRRDTYDIMS